MKSSTFWDITPRKTTKVNLHLCLLPVSGWFLAWLTLQPWRWRWRVSRIVRWLSTDYLVLYPRNYYSSWDATAIKLKNILP
jgi:hypothetical protein